MNIERNFLPSEWLDSRWFLILATLVALNTIIYAAITVARMLPKWIQPTLFRHGQSRSETRSIYPDGPL